MQPEELTLTQLRKQMRVTRQRIHQLCATYQVRTWIRGRQRVTTAQEAMKIPSVRPYGRRLDSKN